MTEREQFEAWMKSLGSTDANLERWIRNPDQYSSRVAQAAWEGWQASRRAAIEEAAKLVESKWRNRSDARLIVIAESIRELVKARALQSAPPTSEQS